MLESFDIFNYTPDEEEEDKDGDGIVDDRSQGLSLLSLIGSNDGDHNSLSLYITFLLLT
jgi:hypothetical protein